MVAQGKNQSLISHRHFFVLSIGQAKWALCYTEASSLLPARCPKCSFLPTWCSSTWHWGLGSQLPCNLGRIPGCLPAGHWFQTRLDLYGAKGTQQYFSGPIWERSSARNTLLLCISFLSQCSEMKHGIHYLHVAPAFSKSKSELIKVWWPEVMDMITSN